jgi:hypothetical protein
MIYKTFYLAQNPSQEYQYQNGLWVKRARGSKQTFYAVDSNGQSVLNNLYKPKSKLKPYWMYSTTIKIVAGIGIIYAGLYLYQTIQKKTVKTV